MITKIIIPCMDIKDGSMVKGVNFVDLRDAGDRVELAESDGEEGADELVFWDFTSTDEKRKTLIELVTKVAKAINIPFTVGGGISTIEDVKALLNAGADKISINSAAVYNQQIVNDMAAEFGSQCIVVAIDTRNIDGIDFVHTHGGRTATLLNTQQWALEVCERGAGEILLTSMDHDGTKAGFANGITSEISSLLSIPVIASGGAGNMEHFRDVFTAGKADAALAASIFHFKEIAIPDLKGYLAEEGVSVRG